jgi:hypothetical protein
MIDKYRRHVPLRRVRERCGLKVEVDPRRIQEVFDRDPPHNGGPKRG